MLKKLAAGFICAGLLGFLPFFVSAKTIINEESPCFYRIKVNIVFDFKYEARQAESEKILADWSTAMNSVWNGIYGSTVINDQCVAFYDFNLMRMASSEDCGDYPDSHCITVVEGKRNSRGNIADIYLSRPNSGKNSTGEWSKYADSLIVAHEVGHLLGLKDEYSYKIVNGIKRWQNANYKESGPQSIMAQTWGRVAALPEHTKAIVAKISPNL